MHTRDVVEQVRNANPTRQHGNISNKRDIPHQLIALVPGIASEHLEFSLVWREAENRIERGCFACAVGADQSKNAPFFNAQIDAVERDGCAEGFAKPARFYRCHVFSDSPFYLNCELRHREALLDSVRAVEWLRAPWANVRKEISAARPSGVTCARRL